MNQTKLESFIEQCLNLGSGFVIACLVWAYVIRPLLKAGYLTVDDTLPITITFTVISIVRGYVWRRFFNAGLHIIVHRIVTRGQ